MTHPVCTTKYFLIKRMFRFLKSVVAKRWSEFLKRKHFFSTKLRVEKKVNAFWKFQESSPTKRYEYNCFTCTEMKVKRDPVAKILQNNITDTLLYLM